MAGKFCRLCHSWEFVGKKDGSDFGVCHNPAVPNNLAVEGKTFSTDDGTLWTGEYFGCVYWRENEGRLLDVEEIIKRKTGKQDGNNI